MITRLVEVLQNIGLEPTAEEIADILRLASHLDQPAEGTGDRGLATSPIPSETASQPAPAVPEWPPKRTETTQTRTQTEPTGAKVYTPHSQEHQTTSAGLKGLPFRSPAASALPGALALGRTLRPLMRRVPSRTRFVLDEEATTQRIADEGQWIPILRPALSRWLEVALVIDEWPSMVIWRQTIAEWQRLLERQGAFRNVRTWGFTADPRNGRVRLHAGTGLEAWQNWTRSPRELIDLRGQRLILIVSDCVSTGWFSGEVARMLATWGQHGLVAIVQMLPERLWLRSAPGNTASVHVRARSPGTPNAQLEIELPWYWGQEKPPAGLPVPVVTLESRSLASWAQSVAGLGNMWIPGVILPIAPSEDYRRLGHEAAPALEVSSPPSPEERFQLFQATVSPMARRLAGYLAAAPLSLPVMRLVQRVMLPESRQVHLAEVFLSGLLTRQSPNDPPIHPDDVHYEFVDGVREWLLSTIFVSDAVDVLTQVSDFIARQTGQPSHFRALIADRTATDQVVIGEGELPFATVAARVLRRLGGHYAQLATRLDQQLEGRQTPPDGVVTAPEGESAATTTSRQSRHDRVRPPRVHITYDVEIGDAIEMKELPFVVGVLADLSGRPDEPLPELRHRRFVEIDRDFLNEVLNRTKPRLAYRVANKLTDDGTEMAVDLRFSSMADFDPEQVVRQIEQLRRLREIRGLLFALLGPVGENDRFSELLQNIISSPELLQRVSQETGTETPGSAEKGPVEAQPNGQRRAPARTDASEGMQQEESLLDLIIRESSIGRDAEQSSQLPRQMETLVEEVMQGTVRVGGNLEEAIHARIADIDRLLSRQLNEVMHAPEFQQLESAWRGLHYLVHQTETSTMLKLRVLNVSKNDLLSDLERTDALDQSVLFQKVYAEEYAMFGGAPYAVLIGDYEFGQHPQDIALLQKIAAVAAAAHAPFIAAADPQLLNLTSFTDLGALRELTRLFDTSEYARWRAFRESEESRYVALTLPRILMRLPYGPDTVPVEGFNFTEVEDGVDHVNYLWGNTAYALGARITDAFAKYGWCAAICGVEGGGLVEGLPSPTVRTGRGNVELKGPTEIAISEAREHGLADLGFIPLVHRQGTDYAAFFSTQTTENIKKYAADIANANARLAAQLQYLLATSRFAHYLKVITRDEIGGFMTQRDLEAYLNRWINNYVVLEDDASPAVKAQRPLREAIIDVSEVPGQSGVYRAVAFLRPHFQLDKLSVALRLVVELPMGARGAVDDQYPEARQRRLPRALIARAEQHRLQGAFERAQRDLDEAIAIAEREDMKVDGYLEYARLSLDMGETAAARKSLKTAKALIDRAGYHQRDEAVRELETQLPDEA